MEAIGEGDLVGESEVIEMKSEVVKLLHKIVNFESNKKCTGLTQQLEEKNRTVQLLQSENLRLLKKVNNFEEQNKTLKREVENLNNEMKLNKREQLRISDREKDCQIKLDEANRMNKTLQQKLGKLNESLKEANKSLENANDNSVQLSEQWLEQENKIQNLNCKVKQLEQFKQESKRIYELQQRMHQRLKSRMGIEILESVVPMNNGESSTPPVQVSESNEDVQNSTNSEEPVASPSQRTLRPKSRKHKNFSYNELHDGSPRPFVCTICGNDFKLERFLKAHTTRKHQETRITPYCLNSNSTNEESEKFVGSQPKRLSISQRFPEDRPDSFLTAFFPPPIQNESSIMDPPTNQTYICQVCTKGFANQAKLKQHSVIHREKTFECTTCGKKFGRAALLRIHDRVHTGVKLYKCGLCPKSFKDAGTLRKHKIIHSGEKRYRCNVCYTRFTQKGALDRHLRFHC